MIYVQALFLMQVDHDKKSDNNDLILQGWMYMSAPNGTRIIASSHSCYVPVLTGYVPAYSVAEVTL